jgi:hypothetical protein
VLNPAHAQAPASQMHDRVNVRAEEEINYWTQRFGVSRARLMQAIDDVGPRLYDLRRLLAAPAP